MIFQSDKFGEPDLTETDTVGIADKNPDKAARKSGWISEEFWNRCEKDFAETRDEINFL